MVNLIIILTSVADQGHFGVDPDPDPRIHASNQGFGSALITCGSGYGSTIFSNCGSGFRIGIQRLLT
jgi:hypothetical protein